MKLLISLNVFKQYSYESGIVVGLLKKHWINVTARTVDETLQQHPDYPSMLSMSDCLKKWNVNKDELKLLYMFVNKNVKKSSCQITF